MTCRVLLLSAYAADSHRYWQQRLQELLPGTAFTILSLPPRHFSWRLRGNALYWAREARRELEAPHDCVLATSTVDLATLRGLVPALAAIPGLLYFHENQFAYPAAPRQQGRLEAQMTSLYSALAANRLLFNSAYNRDSFLRGVSSLLRRLPDYVPAGVADDLAARSEVIPVPLAADTAAVPPGDHPFTGKGPWGPGARPLRLAWLGRLEYDKAPEVLLPAVRALLAAGVELELAVVGRRFRREPAVLPALSALLGSRLVHAGFLESRAAYLALLDAADVALSTARHEFQGIAMLEATARGCLPCVPDALAYPEYYPAAFRYGCDSDDPDAAGAAAAARIQLLARELAAGRVTAPSVSAVAGDQLAPRYEALLGGVATAARRGARDAPAR